MAEILDTIVVDFGDEVSSSDSYRIILDDQLNGVDSDGNPKTTFLVTESVYILLQIPEEYAISKVKSSSGTILNNGLVSRTMTEEQVFFSSLEPVSLQMKPHSNVSATRWYGNSANLTVEESSVKSSNYPCIANISYSYKAYSLKITPPSGLTEEWPVGIVVEASK